VIPVEIRQLTALVAVADAGSVTAAARLLHLVQPAVTRQVRTLEEELGVPLFTRTRQGMALTSAGELLVERARRALAELERARLEISPDHGAVTGVVRAGLLDSVTGLLAEPLTAAVTSRYPGIELRVLTAYSRDLRQWLDLGDLDLSLLCSRPADPPAAAVPLVREQLWAAAPPDAGLTAASPVSWARLLDQPLVLPVPGHGLRTLIDTVLADTGLADTGPADTRLADAGLAGTGRAGTRLADPGRTGTGFGPRLAVQVNSVDLQKQLVLAGRGWTVLPAAGVAGDIAAGRLSGAPLTGPEVTRSVVLGLRPGGRTPAPVLAVAAQLRELTRDLVRSGAWPATLELAQHENPWLATTAEPRSGTGPATGQSW
jgi:DNA-binding transcriptional LysR family regulator